MSMGWIRHVANAPEIPPITNGANKLSKLDEFIKLEDCGDKFVDMLLAMD